MTDKPTLNDLTPAGTATNYHESVDDLRRDLMKGAAHWEKVADEYKDPADKLQARMLSAAVMAGGYAYTLAAIIGYARKYGEHVAHDLAFEADEILTNGDFEGLNSDVIASGAEGLTFPDCVTVDATRGAHGETPGAHWRCAIHDHTGTWADADDNALAARAEAISHLDKLHDGWRDQVKPPPASLEVHPGQATIPAGGEA